MKLLNKLLPITSLLSSACLVAPIISSCSNPLFSTTDINFVPKVQHEESKAKLTHEEIAKDYLSKTSYFVEDLAYHRLSFLKEWVEEQIKPYKDNPNYSNVTSSCILSIDTMKIKGDVEKRKLNGNEGWFYAYGCPIDLSLTFDSQYQYTYTVPKKDLDPTIQKEADTTYYTSKYHFDIQNCFIYLYFTNYDWNIGLYVDKNFDWSYSITSSTVESWEFKVTKLDKEETTTGESSTGNKSSDSRGMEMDEYALVLEDEFYGTVVSYYLKNVSPKDEINSKQF